MQLPGVLGVFLPFYMFISCRQELPVTGRLMFFRRFIMCSKHSTWVIFLLAEHDVNLMLLETKACKKKNKEKPTKKTKTWYSGIFYSDQCEAQSQLTCRVTEGVASSPPCADKHLFASNSAERDLKAGHIKGLTLYKEKDSL